MTKSRRRDSIKSFLRNHMDPERDEQLQATKIEVEHKITKILNIIKNVDQDGRGENREGDAGLELVELVEDLHGQYQSLYSIYDNLRAELRKNAHERKEEDSSSTSYSSDSESFHSSKEVDSNNGKHFEHELQKQIAQLKLDLEAANSEATTMEDHKTLTEREYEPSARIEELENQVSSLQLELESALAQERSLEEQVESAAAEAKEQLEEILGLRGRILELEMTSKEKDEKEMNDADTQVMALMAEINGLHVELNSLQTSKIQIENRNKELLTKISEQDDTINRMNMQCKQVKVLRRQSKMNFQSTERKVEEIAEQFRKSMEDNLRLVAQRIRVAERLHYENRDFYWTTREALKVEQKAFQEQVAAHKSEFRKLERAIKMTSDAVSGFDLVAERLSVSSEIFLNRLSRISDELLSARNWIKGTKDEIKELKGEKLDLMRAVNHLEERVGEMEKVVKEKDERVNQLEERVGELEKIVNKKDERINQLEERVGELKKIVKEKDERVNQLEERVGELEKIVKKKDARANQLEERVGELKKMVKEKDERVVGLGEEKREAIRQLCICIDYQRSDLHSLKILAKRSSRRRTTTT